MSQGGRRWVAIAMRAMRDVEELVPVGLDQEDEPKRCRRQRGHDCRQLNSGLMQIGTTCACPMGWPGGRWIISRVMTKSGARAWKVSKDNTA